MIGNASRSKTNEVLETLRNDILTCRLWPGDKLKINQLAERLDVSLSAVREALSALAADGLVIAEPQKGFRITPISTEDLIDVSSVRCDIEVKCLAMAIQKGGIDWETGIVAALHRLNRTPERAESDNDLMNDDWSTAHDLFHESLLQACDSAWLLRLRKSLFNHTERYRQLSIPLGSDDRRSDDEHEELAQAVLARDVDLACSLVTTHLNRTMEILLTSDAVVKSGSGPAR